MPSPMTSMATSMQRWQQRLFKVEYCTIVRFNRKGESGIQCHSPDHPEYYNTVTLKVRNAKENVDPLTLEYQYEVVIQDFVGNCFGHPWTPRVGDLVMVLFLYNAQPIILGPVNTTYQVPPMRGPTCTDAMYDDVWKWCQWLAPVQDDNHDYYNHPEGKKPICKKIFHGPITGSTGKGRDVIQCWDCAKGDNDPTCTLCETIDSVGRDTADLVGGGRTGEQWFKQYSSQTESTEAYNSRAEWHSRCGSYLRFESDDENTVSSPSVVYSEEIGHIRLGNALTESDQRFHLNVQGDRYGSDGAGTFDLHTNYEGVQLKDESTGVRFAATRPDDDQVLWAYELMDFPTTSFIRCYKTGIIEICSDNGNSVIILDGTTDKITVDGTTNVEIVAAAEVTCSTPLTHVTGNMQIDGSCSHGSCSCQNGTSCIIESTSGRALIKNPSGEWTTLGDTTPVTSISCYSSTKYCGCDGAGKVYTCDGSTWTELSSSPSMVSSCCGCDGLYYAVDSSGKAYYWDENTSAWIEIS